MNLIRSLFLAIVMLCAIGEPAFANPTPLTTTLTAPSPGQTFSNMPSGTTYKADASGNVSNVLASDVPAMLKAGCTQPTGGGGGGGGATLPYPGIVYGTGPTGGTVATSNQIQSAIGTGIYDAAGAATTAQNAPNVSGATGVLPVASDPALTGDVTKAAGSSATTVTQINGGAVPASATLLGTNASGQAVSGTLASVGAQPQTFGLPTVSAAPLAVYSTRLLVPTYTGPLFRIVNISTSATLQIFANGDGSPNLSGVLAFLNGTAQANVDIVYDQTGGGNNATQTTAGSRPFFTLTNAINGVPSITFDGNQNNGTMVLPSSLTGSGQATTIVNIAAPESTNAATVSMVGAAQATAGSVSSWYGYPGYNNKASVVTSSNVYSVATAHSRSQVQVLGVASGTSNISIYQDNYPAQTVTASPAGTWAGGLFGGGGYSAYFNGEWFGMVVYPAALTATDFGALMPSLNKSFNIITGATAQLVSPGNSIVQGTKATLNQNNLRQTETNLNRKIFISNQGVYGQLEATEYSNLAIYQAEYNSAYQYNLALAPEPTNDIGNSATGSIVGIGTTLFNSYTVPFVQSMQTTGFTMLVPTIIARNWANSNSNTTSQAQMETERLAYNALVRAGAATYGYTVLDYASLPQLSNYSNATYISSSDGTHPTSAGYSVMATLQAGAINELLSVAVPRSVATGGTGATTAQAALAALQGQPFFYVANYGAKSNGLMLTDVATTSGNAVVTSTAHAFSSADVGKYVVIPNASGTNSTLTANISSINGNSATLSGSPSVTLSNATMYFGADDTTAINAAITAASAAGGGVVVLPTGRSMIGAGGAGLAWPSHVSMVGAGMTQSALDWDYFGNGGHGMIYNTGQSSSNPITDVHFSDFEANAVAMTSYSVSAKVFYMKYLLRPVFERLYLHDSPATSLGTDFLVQATIRDNIILNGGRLNNGTQAGGAGIGIGTDNETEGGFQQSATVEGNHIYMSQGSRFGIFFEQQGSNQPIPLIGIRIIGNWIYSSNGHGIQDAGNTGMVIEGNQVIGTGAAGCLDGISVGPGSGTTGTIGTQDTIVGNEVQGMRNGIGLDYSNQGYTSVNPPVNSIIEANHLHGNVNDGISVTTYASQAIVGLAIKGNYAYSNGAAGIYLTGAAGYTDVDISGNHTLNNGTTTATATQKAGITINSNVTRLTLRDNTAADNLTGTQSYGLAVASGFAVTGGLMEVNHFGSNATSALDMLGTFTGLVANNYGFPTFTVSGACSSTSPVGQGDVGTFLSGTSGTCTTTILPYGTANIIAPNGWSCLANDLTTSTDLIGQTASTTTGCTLTGTTVSGDKIAFLARAF